jgi:hypothetical protein
VLHLPKEGEEKVDKPDRAATGETKAGATESSPAQDASRKEPPRGEGKPAETPEKNRGKKE